MPELYDDVGNRMWSDDRLRDGQDLFIFSQSAFLRSSVILTLEPHTQSTQQAEFNSSPHRGLDLLKIVTDYFRILDYENAIDPSSSRSVPNQNAGSSNSNDERLCPGAMPSNSTGISSNEVFPHQLSINSDETENFNIDLRSHSPRTMFLIRRAHPCLTIDIIKADIVKKDIHCKAGRMLAEAAGRGVEFLFDELLRNGNMEALEEMNLTIGGRGKGGRGARERTEEEPMADTSLVSCGSCEEKVISVHYLKLHVLTKHCKEYQYLCPLCLKDCPQVRDLLGHLANNHGMIKEFVCLMCFKDFGYKRNLTTHMKESHKQLKARPGSATDSHPSSASGSESSDHLVPNND